MIYDISPIISNDLDVWPGDSKYSREILLDMNKGDNLTLSTIRCTVHLGAHTDAPNHYNPDGQDISERSLEYYLGHCQVIRLEKEKNSRISVEDIDNKVIQSKRVLFYTGTFNPYDWNNDFCAFEPSCIEFLANKDVKLVGIDTPSVDLFDDKNLIAHNSIYKNDMAILEGVVLDRIEEGFYELIALPLKIKEAEASPVRAILRTL